MSQDEAFTKDLIEAGLKLSQRDIFRDRFILGREPGFQGQASVGPASGHFLAELLADPEKAARLSSFFQPVLGFDRTLEMPEALPPDILPWSYQAKFAEKMADPLAEAADREALAQVRDFWGRSIALMAGVALAGAARLNDLLLYSKDLSGRAIERYDGDDFLISAERLALPNRASTVLILAFVRDPAIMGMNPALAGLKPSKGWLGWEEQLNAVNKVSAFIQGLGYLALPSAGGIVLADHHGALAGLGELGRQGLLITPEYGPNLRLFTIITDYPFVSGEPDVFGVADYCETCQRCINECPARAISEGHRSPGLYQWPVDRKACFDNWLNKGDACRKCIEICPYTREPLIGSKARNRQF